MNYSSIKQIAEMWHLSTRRVNALCSQGRIPRAVRIGSFWAIPSDSIKPKDARLKSDKYIKGDVKGNDK